MLPYLIEDGEVAFAQWCHVWIPVPAAHIVIIAIICSGMHLLGGQT